ncbi:MAG: branched-chain amino acid ABC transporter ATP-binding protein/permease [Candidatus Limnocylindrales bacterium]
MRGRPVLGFLAVAVVLAAVPWVQDALGVPVFYLVFLAGAMFWVAQATSWNILSGYSGYFSFGQAAFFGVGAYTTAVLMGRQKLDFFVTLPVAAVLAGGLALLVGWLAFRLRSLRGEIFALLTLAIPFIVAPIIRITPWIDGGQGVQVPVPAAARLVGGFQPFLYLVSAAIALLAVGVAYAIQHSRMGWGLFAIRDAEPVAEGLGVPTFRLKMLAIAATGAIGGLAGCVFALQVGFLTVEGVFGLTVPLFVIVMSVLGGRYHWLGPTLGAVVIFTLQNRLAAGGFEGLSLIVLGMVLVALVLLAPEGLMARIAVRPLAVIAASIATFAALAISSAWGTPLDWLAVAMVAGAAVSFLPVPRRRIAREVTRLMDDEPTVAAGEGDPGMAGLAPSGQASSGPIIEASDVARTFGGIQALRGVTLRVAEGELVGLVGPNGSGKTTLVNLVSGAYRPSAGTLRIAGSDVAGIPPHRVSHLGVARTYQIPRPFESMTVRDNVALAIMFGRAPLPLAAARRAALEHLDLVGLGHLAGARPSGINLHERQLLEMARALATRPRVLLLDEALAGLSPVEVDAAVRVVRRIHASGVTIVLVEHLLRVVNQLATRVVVLDQGRVLAQGAPGEVMRDPSVVAAYLGSAAADVAAGTPGANAEGLAAGA